MTRLFLFALILASCTSASRHVASGEQCGDVLRPGTVNELGYTWKSCERDDLGGATVPFSASGAFVPGCAPDVVYSWHKRSTVLAIAASSTPANVLPVKSFYTWRTPLSTFGYGDTLVRIKLKPNVRFEPISVNDRDCSRLEGKDNVVYVDYMGGPMWPANASEYLICSSGVVDSWSYGRAETLAEMERDAQWISTHSAADFDQYSKSAVFDISHFCGMSFTEIDQTDFSHEALARNFELARSSAASGEGRIFFAEGGSPDHFGTRAPGYFNPLPSKDAPFSAANYFDPARNTIPTVYQQEQRALALVRDACAGQSYSSTYHRRRSANEDVFGVSVQKSGARCDFEVHFTRPDAAAAWKGEARAMGDCSPARP